MLALKAELKRQGVFCTVNRVAFHTLACLFNSMNFNPEYLYKVKRTKPAIRMVHRVDGPKASYRGNDDGSDRKVWEYNRDLADASIFQSQFSLQEYCRMGFEFINPVVIPNAVDPVIFHAQNRLAPPDGHRKIKLIATAWSDNPNKGADVHQWLDQNLDHNRYEFCFVGRTQVELTKTRVVAPVPSAELAALLRDHDIYIAASINDPCSNALLEALACKLPIVYRQSGGHPELVKKGGVGFCGVDDILDAIDQAANNYQILQQAIDLPSIESIAEQYLAVMKTSANNKGKDFTTNLH